MDWNEATKTLIIKNRNGEFPGMLKDRTFHIVWVNATNGQGIEPGLKFEIIKYSGQEISIMKK